eukprot:c21095_g1_i1 orf=159-1022(+)
MEPLTKRIKSDTNHELNLETISKVAGGCTNGSSGNKSDKEEERPLLPLLGSVSESSTEVGCPGARQTTGDVWVAVEADAAEDKGSRHTMEDAWVVLPDASLGQPGKLRCAHFAIYDGHGGRQAADFARNHLHANVVSAGLPRELLNVKAAKKAIITGFKHTDEALLRESITGGWQDGATAVCVWILGSTVFIANVGDAKAVLARVANTGDKGEEKSQSCPNASKALAQGLLLKGVTITREHKAIFPLERARIEKAGGYVGENGRLLGRLEVSRAFGDRQFKKVLCFL